MEKLTDVFIVILMACVAAFALAAAISTWRSVLS